MNESYGAVIKLITILLSIIEGDISLNDKPELSHKNIKAIVKLLKHQLKDPKLSSVPQYVTRLLHHICNNIKIFTTRYDITFSHENHNKIMVKYKALSQFLCDDECQLFKLDLVYKLFPNLSTIAIERSVLEAKVFDNILPFLKKNNSNNLIRCNHGITFDRCIHGITFHCNNIFLPLIILLLITIMCTRQKIVMSTQ